MLATMSDSSTAAAVRGRVRRSRDRFWHPEDFNGSPEAVGKALSRLTTTGELRRLRRGLYWRGRSTPLGMAPPPASRLATELINEPGSGPAGLTAALSLGLTTQVPRIDIIAVPGRAPRPVPGLRFVTREAAWRRRDERLRVGDVALLEVLRSWPDLVEVPTDDAIERIASLTRDDRIDLARVIRASSTEPPLVRERLRSLLRRLDRDDEAEKVRPARTPAAVKALEALG